MFTQRATFVASYPRILFSIFLLSSTDLKIVLQISHLFLHFALLLDLDVFDFLLGRPTIGSSLLTELFFSLH